MFVIRAPVCPDVSPGSKVRGVAVLAVDGVVCTPALRVDEELEEKPWRKPGVYVQERGRTKRLFSCHEIS